MFLDPRFKHSMASDKQSFSEQVERWINEESTDVMSVDLETSNSILTDIQETVLNDSIFNFHANFANDLHEKKPNYMVSAS
jgi:hypothetical protein